jgi:hypothetical protein
MPQSGQSMPPSGVPEGTPAKSVENARKVARDGWAQHGNKTPAEALQNDQNVVRKPIDPKSLGPVKK